MSFFICCFSYGFFYFSIIIHIQKYLVVQEEVGLLTTKYTKPVKKASDPEEDRARLQSGNATVEEAISRATRGGRVLLCHSATPITIEQRISFFVRRDFWVFVAYVE